MTMTHSSINLIINNGNLKFFKNIFRLLLTYSLDMRFYIKETEENIFSCVEFIDAYHNLTKESNEISKYDIEFMIKNLLIITVASSSKFPYLLINLLKLEKLHKQFPNLFNSGKNVIYNLYVIIKDMVEYNKNKIKIIDCPGKLVDAVIGNTMILVIDKIVKNWHTLLDNLMLKIKKKDKLEEYKNLKINKVLFIVMDDLYVHMLDIPKDIWKFYSLIEN